VPASAAARSELAHDWLRERRTAISCAVPVAFGRESLSALSTPARSIDVVFSVWPKKSAVASVEMFSVSLSRSLKLGTLVVRPPPARKESSAALRASAPDATRRVFCSVSCWTYGLKISGTMMSETRVLKTASAMTRGAI
jgi:hypothetical protein